MSIAPFTPPPSVPVNRLFDFSGRRVLVTGARKSIGQVIAARFAEAGADVVIGVRAADDAAQTASLVKAHGRQAEVLPVDLTDELALTEALSSLAPVDVVVNNAGAYPVEPMAGTSGERFDAIVQANLGTAYRVSRAVAARWANAERTGAIVNVSSVEATRPAFGHAHYASGKAGLDHLTRCMAVELGPTGTRVNAVAPGLVHYPELMELWPEGVQRYRERALLGREGDPREIADACLFLASPAASWVTGTVLTVDGGVSAAPHF